MASLAARALSLALVTAILTGTACRTPDQQLEVHSACQANEACVLMTLDSRDSVSVGIAQDSTGFTVFSHSVRGSLANDADQTYQLRIRGYTDGMTCSAFGQATVAVIGHTPDKQPIILTDRGPFALADTTLIVGCVHCARIREVASQRIVDTQRTPGWDLSLARTSPDSLGVSDDGVLFLRQAGTLIKLTRDGAFQVVSDLRASSRYQVDLEIGGCT